MKISDYALRDTADLPSPALIYYKDIIVQNTEKIISMAGGAARLWPHVKTHKSANLVRLQMGYGIERFKCATIAEAEMLADLKAPHILLAYPLIGPNKIRYIRLANAHPGSRFYAIGDDYGQLALLSAACRQENMVMPVLIDINTGMNRTGVALEEAQELCEKCAALDGISVVGLHCYDGHNNDGDINQRRKIAKALDQRIVSMQISLRKRGFECGLCIAGGTPSFPCHMPENGWFLSPGTGFIHDMAYFGTLHEMPLVPGAALFSRVVSHPASGLFTLDVGAKAIATDPVKSRGVIVGLEQAVPVLQSEEHWVFSMPDGQESRVPAIGDELYVIPTHICPTTALYPSILVAEGGRITAEWPVTARNRSITC